MAFSGTMVVSGRAKGVGCRAPGRRDELGASTQCSPASSAIETPLLRQIKSSLRHHRRHHRRGARDVRLRQVVKGMDFVELFQAVSASRVVISEALPANSSPLRSRSRAALGPKTQRPHLRRTAGCGDAGSGL
jgi:hypothetical protein